MTDDIRSVEEELAAAEAEMMGNGSRRREPPRDGSPPHAVDDRVRPSIGSIDKVVEVFQEWLYIPDARVVDVTLATYTAHHRRGDPLWTAIVGASGGGKTEPIRALEVMPDAYMLSKLTPQTFASGLKNNPRASLLTRLEEDKQSFVIMKDFTSILSMHRDAQRELLADLREIYDGAFDKDFGSGESVHWRGRLGLLLGVTPEMDQARKVNEIMGERFVYYRLPKADRRKLVKKAQDNRGRESEMRQALTDAVAGFLADVEFERTVELSEEPETRMLALADLATLGRSHVARDRNHEVLTLPTPEAPTRFVKQLGALADSLMVLGRDEAQAMELVEKISLDSLPPPRLACIRFLIENAGDVVKTTDVANAVKLPPTTCGRVLEDLTALRMADREGSGQDLRWMPTEYVVDLWNEAGIGGSESSAPEATQGAVDQARPDPGSESSEICPECEWSNPGEHHFGCRHYEKGTTK